VSPLIKGRSTDSQLDAAGLRAILVGCRFDLDTVRYDVACDGGSSAGDVASGLEQRLCQVAERLERATDALDRMLDFAAETASAPVAAEVLVREADHRIKNSLQIVMALLHRQASQAEADAVRDALYAAGGRVAAVAQVHATLHAATRRYYGVVPELDLDTYLGGLCAALGRALGVDGGRRTLLVAVEPLAVSPATAQSLGLTITELVTNALRHAFLPDRPGTVRVLGARRGDGWYQLCVEDDGKGLPPDFNLCLRPSGLGLRLVNMLADQLRARLTVDGRVGARFALTLPLLSSKPGDSLTLS
jgi:two-component sensor histidine kinase